MKFSIPPGVFDITPENANEPWKSTFYWTHVEAMIRETAGQYGFREIRTPLFERTELFLRSVGETSDIVSKEMYTFEDKGKRSMSLRPEGTAPAMRAFIENQLIGKGSIHKLFYIAPMFRYERAQAGRYRQHHQFGAEAIGSGSPEQDAELIDLLYTLYNRLGLKNLSLSINSIGDAETRTRFKQALQDTLRPHFNELSTDSQTRFENNPLRILDSKDPKDREICKKAPLILDFLSEESKDHFEELKKLLSNLKIPYSVNPFLVRGLDYYNKTVFEVAAGELGAQNSIGGGGRYDGLIESLGGPSLPASGFGTGLERIIQTMINQQVPPPPKIAPEIFLIPLGELSKEYCFSLLHELRINGIAAEMDFTGRKLVKIMQYANLAGAKYTAVIGDNEIGCGDVSLKEMATGKEKQMRLSDIAALLKFERKNEQFFKLWDEMSEPLQSASQTQYLTEQLQTSIKETNELAENIKTALEKLKTILEK